MTHGTAVAVAGRVMIERKSSSAVEAASRAADAAMARYAQGDSGAFDAVYDFVGPRLVASARRRCRSEALVEDLVHETFARMIHYVRTFAVGSEVLPWARAILRRLIADPTNRRRQQGRELLIEVDGQSLTTAVVSAVERADDLFDAKRLATAINTALLQLGAPQRDAFQLVELEGRSIRQAAAALGTTELGVRLRLHRAMTSLRRATGDGGVKSRGGAARSDSRRHRESRREADGLAASARQARRARPTVGRDASPSRRSPDLLA